MAIGVTRRTLAGSGDHTPVRSAVTAIGRRIVTDIGPGVRPMAGPGSAMNRGAGRHITTVAGCTTTIIGPGRRVADSIATAVGGGPL
jgi:hypothetical protein